MGTLARGRARHWPAIYLCDISAAIARMGVRRDVILEQVLGFNWMMAAPPTLIAWRATIQPRYQWGMFGVTGEGTSAGYFLLILPLVALGWANFTVGARRPEARVFPLLLLAWNGIWFGASLYGAITLGDRMTMRGDALGVSVPVNVIAPVASGTLLALSIYWIATRRGREWTVEGNDRVARALMIAGLAAAPLIAALFAVGAYQRGGRHTNWDRAAVLVFIAHMVLVGLGINPWRNRFGKKT
jgi:hypothetical protein